MKIPPFDENETLRFQHKINAVYSCPNGFLFHIRSIRMISVDSTAKTLEVWLVSCPYLRKTQHFANVECTRGNPRGFVKYPLVNV